VLRFLSRIPRKKNALIAQVGTITSARATTLPPSSGTRRRASTRAP
jgi:hypothetical protein